MIRTNDEATVSRLSAATAGYLADPYVALFVRSPKRRPPLINRGTYARTSVVRGAIARFVAGGGEQVVSLGAGFDTAFFCLAAEEGALRESTRFFELDFAAVVTQKAAVVRGSAALRALAGVGEGGDAGRLLGERYAVLAADLRDVGAVEAALASAGFDGAKPTLFVAEAVLVYMEAARSDALIEWARASCPSSAFLLYEMVRPDDAFGREMVANIETRGCPLLSIRTYPGLKEQRQRFLSRGWAKCTATDMQELYSRVVCADAAETSRLQRVEMLDEFEQFDMIMRHYCIVIATVGGHDCTHISLPAKPAVPLHGGLKYID